MITLRNTYELSQSNSVSVYSILSNFVHECLKCLYNISTQIDEDC